MSRGRGGRRHAGWILVLPLLISACDSLYLRGFFHSRSDPDGRFEESRTLPMHSDTDSLEHPFQVDGEYVYSFPVVSDIHLSGGVSDVLTLFIAEELLPDDLFILDCGDSTQSGRESDFTAYRGIMEEGGKPFFQSIGNHDTFYDGWSHYKALLGKSVYTLEVGGAGMPGSLLLICLDSAGSTLGRKQIRWLEECLEEERDRRDHCIVFTHCNVFPLNLTSADQFSDKEEIYRLMNLFEQHDVDLVLMGHDHQWNRRQFNGVEYLNLEPLKYGSGDTSCLRVRVRGRDLTLERVPF